MFLLENFFISTIFFTNLSFSSIISSTPTIPSSISFILLECLSLQFLFALPWFSTYWISSGFVSFIDYSSIIRFKKFYSFPSNVFFFSWPYFSLRYLFFAFFICLFLDFFRGFIKLYFKDMYHLYNLFLRSFLCISYVGKFRVCCGRTAGLWSHIALPVIVCVLKLVFGHLCLSLL